MEKLTQARTAKPQHEQQLPGISQLQLSQKGRIPFCLQQILAEHSMPGATAWPNSDSTVQITNDSRFWRGIRKLRVPLCPAHATHRWMRTVKL